MFTYIHTIVSDCYRRQKLDPFETMFGFFCIFAGITTLLNFGIITNPLNTAFITYLGYKTHLFLSVIYLLSGLSIFFGIGFRKGNIEAFGLITLITVIIARTIVLGFLLGINPIIINTYVSNIAFVFASIIRLLTIRQNNRFLLKNGNNSKLVQL